MSFIKSRRILIFVLFIILFLGFFLRFYKLSSIPNGPEWDEASVGYNAFSIATTGRDEWGNKFPLIFKAFGDYKNPIYIYLSAIIIKFLGLSIFSTRFINAFSGGLLVLIWYFIAKITTKDKNISLLTAFFLAVSPFGIFFSRIAGDGIILSVFFISLGIMFELLYLDKKKSVFFFLSILCLLLSIFTYNLARVITPILIILILFLNIKIVKNKLTYIPILLICALFFLLVVKQSNISLQSRLQFVGIFGEQKGTVLQIKELREHDKNSFISKITHNKLTNYTLTLADNYISYFSSQFLLGFNDNHLVYDSQYPPLFIILLPFFYLGIVIFIKEIFEKKESNNKTVRILLLTLLFIAPIPAVIAEGVSGKRSLALLGIMQFLSAYGLIFFYNNLKKKSWKKNFLIIFVILILINLIHYLFFYFFTFPKKYGIYYASRENRICQFIKNNYRNYDSFIYSRKINGFAYIFPLFCLSYPPDKYWLTRTYTEKDGWFSIDSFDKFIFPDEINSAFLQNLVNNKNKKIAIFLNEDENSKISFNFENTKTTRLPIPSEAHNELFLYDFEIL
jgi:4-amino-4-deoxy-L-arabinose transferase-like glycosyltransferase